MKPTGVECGLDVSLAVMGGKWKPLILYHLRSGPVRFGDLKRLVGGISEKVLIQQLRELVAAEVLIRHDYQQVPPKVDYAVTAFGKTLIEALLPLCVWGTQHRSRVEAMQRPPIPPAEKPGEAIAPSDRWEAEGGSPDSARERTGRGEARPALACDEDFRRRPEEPAPSRDREQSA